MFASKLNLFSSLLSKCQSLISKPGVRSISTTLQKPLTTSSQCSFSKQVSATGTCSGSNLLQPAINLYNRDNIRTIIRCNYRPNALKRIRKHGLEKRLSKPSQRQILFRRIVKGRHNLCAFDRFLNRVPDLPVKGKKRVNLFDPKEGYRTVLKKPEYFRFE